VTSTTSKIILAVAAVAGQLLFVGAHRADAIEIKTEPTPPTKIYGRIVRDHRAKPTPWALPKHYHNHNVGPGRRR
jgi:hypothetical protein